MRTERPVQIAGCERHGLKYNAAIDSGCVRCRRQDTPSLASATAAPRTASVPLQLLLAALLVGATGGLFCAAQRAMIDGYTILHRAAERGAATAAAPAATAGTVSPDATQAQRELQQLKRVEQLLQRAQRQRAGATESAQSADEQPQ